jgi:hypothetical protein
MLPGQSRYLAVVLFVLLSGAGVYGFIEHMENREGDEIEAATPALEVHEEENESDPPPLAPLAVTGLALLGAAAVMAREE